MYDSLSDADAARALRRLADYEYNPELEEINRRIIPPPGIFLA